MKHRNAHFRRPPGRWHLPLAMGWMIACLVLGGASNAGQMANIVLQLGGAAVIGWTLWRGTGIKPAAGERGLLLALLVLVGWIAMTLIPLPPAVWTLVPGRTFVAAGYRLLGVELPWLPLSLSDDRTVRSALALLVPVSSYLLVRRLDPDERNRLALAVVIAACLSVLLGMAQLLGGPDSPLRPYSITNRSDPVGLFANTNHFATMLLVAIPLAGAAFIERTETRRKTLRLRTGRAFGLGAMAICGLGLVLVGSNAGLLLLLPAMAGAVLLGPARHLLEQRRIVLALGMAGAAIAAIVVAGMSSGVLTQKLGVSATSRQQITATTLKAARDFLPAGSGLGSFSAIYVMQSGGQGTSGSWTNHAHDDPAEVLLELGIPGLLLMGAFAVWLLRQSLAAWQDPARTDRTARLARAAALGLLLVVVHSFVDYPLRAAAIAALFGMALALLIGRDDAERTGAAT
ncbi:MAG: O-antigen ligase family protein [Novosphingobium sp.]|nr:O-antigen ligase family protein [Novosphingobium sp.]